MMKKSLLPSAICLVFTLSMSSCSQRLIDFTLISSKNVSFGINKVGGKSVKGADIMFLGIGVSIKDAMDKALQSAGPEYDILVDGVVRIKAYPFVSGYTVEGIAISSSKLKADLGEKGFDNWCKNNNITFSKEEAEIKN